MLNVPEKPNMAMANGKRLCEELLEPLQATFGGIAIRSAYRSPKVNAFANEKGYKCGLNVSNYAAHIWDYPDKDGLHGAMACIVIPDFADKCEVYGDWRALAYWIQNHLNYREMQFFPRLCAFNIG